MEPFKVDATKVMLFDTQIASVETALAEDSEDLRISNRTVHCHFPHKASTFVTGADNEDVLLGVARRFGEFVAAVGLRPVVYDSEPCVVITRDWNRPRITGHGEEGWEYETWRCVYRIADDSFIGEPLSTEGGKRLTPSVIVRRRAWLVIAMPNSWAPEPTELGVIDHDVEK